ncbi:hypothetical protein, partial [Yoonia vestfoldensis]|uniref:hypothetical protein n=1 Tax=Yoonia vestfoldensis TaxID=245188 RepID=UPI00039B6716
MTVEYCGDAFCVPKKQSMDIACHDLGKEAGKWIMYEKGKSLCYCICSCVGEGTLIAAGDGAEIPIETVEIGKTTVLAAGRSLDFKPKLVESMVGTSKGETQNTIYLKYTMNGVPLERVVTMDHPFLLKNGTLVGAGVLQVKDELVDDNGDAVQIDEIRWGTYVGQFFELAISLDPPNQNLDGHLVLTDGVVTGDYAVSIYVDFPVNADETKTLAENGRPFVGSAEWREQNGVNPGCAMLGMRQMNGGVFIPADHFTVDIPDHASAFLPGAQAIALRYKAKKLPLSDQYRLDMSEFVIKNIFMSVYPDLNYEFNWYDDTINSYSWVDTLTGEPTIYLSGGLARMEGFEIEGLTLAIAHEIGHLMGRPTFENGVTCEGQADWYGASIVLRSVWFGEEYFRKMDMAIAQMEVLYRYLRRRPKDDLDLDVTPPEEDATGQPYPSNACRLLTFETAKLSPTPPECALCAEPVGSDFSDDDDNEESLLVDDGGWIFVQDDGDDPLPMAKVSGARDRQRRKKQRLPADPQTEATLAKSSGARDRQRRKKLSAEPENDLGTVDGAYAKINGARDRQRKKKYRLIEASTTDDSGAENATLAKASGARDRQRRKKR